MKKPPRGKTAKNRGHHPTQSLLVVDVDAPKPIDRFAPGAKSAGLDRKSRQKGNECTAGPASIMPLEILQTLRPQPPDQQSQLARKQDGQRDIPAHEPGFREVKQSHQTRAQTGGVNLGRPSTG